MPDPRQVFDDPHRFWAFITAARDADFEGQHFDRKEACRVNAQGVVSQGDLRTLREDNVAGWFSAFANSNTPGGLLVLGIESDGSVRGVSHLTEPQRNALANVDDLLVNQAAEVRFLPCKNATGQDDAICLIFV